jgi:type I restriction enzyme M protein
MLDAGDACFSSEDAGGQVVEPLPEFAAALAALREALQPFLNTLGQGLPPAEATQELDAAARLFIADMEAFEGALEKEQAAWKRQKTTNGELKQAVERLAPLAETSRDLIKQMDLLYKLACRVIETCETGSGARDSSLWANREITRGRKAVDEARQVAVAQLKQVRYFHRQARWLTERFPEAKLRDVPGLVKLVDRAEIAANDWSLTPGRYVGVAPEAVDDDFDFEETLRTIHVELEDLNAEAVQLAAKIKKNFEELGV